MGKGLPVRLAIAVFIFGYLLTLIWTLPAAVVWSQFESRLPAAVTLHGLRGTLWSGQVARMSVEGIDQGRLSWRWRPGQLLRGQLGLDMVWQPANGKVNAQMDASMNSLKLSAITGVLDAASMAKINNAPFVLRGNWLLDIPELILEDFDKVTAADGRLVWQEAAGGLPQPLFLGHLTARLSAAEDQLLLALQDEGGPLALEGDARWQPGHPMYLDLRMQTRPTAERGLIDGLALLGKPDAQGWVRWQQQLQ